MKYLHKLITLILITGFVSVLSAAGSTQSPSIGGATGLITTPNAQTGWSGHQFGVDTGVHYIASGNDSVTPKITLTVADRFELGGAFDIQGTDNNDFLFHGKFRFYPWSGGSNTVLAFGGNVQSLNYGPNASDTAGQIYLATTYTAEFLRMPAETTLVFGKTFTPSSGSNLDFSMGFDLNLLPSVFQGYIHWLLDFANYSYSVNSIGVSSSRGIFNTGIRVTPLSSMNNLKLNLDVLLLDSLDTTRSFGAGIDFGMAF